jgi:tetratricopeptide (TPR) repeat protein
LACASAAPLRSEQPDPGVVFLEKRFADDPDDFIAANQLVDRLLKRYRWLGRLEDLRRADRVAELSLKAMAAELNTGGLAGRIQTAQAMHRFVEARDLARQLETLLPGKALPPQLLGDALLELGDLDGAAKAYAQMLERTESDPSMEGRLARVAWLRGDLKAAGERLDTALQMARDSSSSSTPLPWALLRRGEHAFRTGDWKTAEKLFTEAIETSPGDWNLLGHLGELRAAQGRDAEAVDLFTRAATATDRPELWQALGDYHAFAKRPAEAASAYEKALAGYRDSLERGEVLYVHHLAGFYADSQPNAEEAVKWARRDLELRQSAHAWDALAWALYQNNDLPAALDAAKKSLASGLADSHVLYHAGMIQLSNGAIAEGQALLKRCAEINPYFSNFHVHR